MFYQAGIQAVIALAAIYAQQAMGFTTQDTIMLILVVNVTAAIGAFAFGQFQDRLGHVRTIALTLVGWIVTVVARLVGDRAGARSGSRRTSRACASARSSRRAARWSAIFARAIARAEFFGLWGLAVKLSSILGPLTYGLVTWLSGGDHRLAMLITGVYFVAGLAVLATIDVRRGRREAMRAGRRPARASAATGRS